MKQESKVKRIYQAFTDGADIPQEIIDARRKICAECPFNSNNSESLTLIQKQRKALLGENNPFCTACGCQIDEKTARGSEACGLEDKGLIVKWGRVFLNTADEVDINVENLNPEKINLSVNYEHNGFLIIFIDDIVIGKSPITFELLFDRDVTYHAGCSCFKDTKLNGRKLKVSINTSGFSTGSLLKNLDITYKLEDGRVFTNTITLKGTLINEQL